MNRFRNPENNYNSFIDATNNVVYGHETTRTWEVGYGAGYAATANAIGIYTKTTNANSTSYGRTIYIIDYSTAPAERIYMTGVLDGTRDEQTDPQWSVQEYFSDVTATTAWRRDTPFATTGFTGNGIAVTAQTMSSEYASYVVAHAGATKPVRDGVDTAVAAHYEAGTGTFTNSAEVDTVAEIEALVDLSSPAAPTDSDADGMSDAWETAQFGDLDQTAATDYDSDGYTDLEEYLHILGGYAVGTGQSATFGGDTSLRLGTGTTTITVRQ